MLLKTEIPIAFQNGFGSAPAAGWRTDEAVDLDEFGDHFGEHPKTAGRTFTGGPDYFLKNIFTPRLVRQACLGALAPRKMRPPASRMRISKHLVPCFP